MADSALPNGEHWKLVLVLVPVLALALTVDVLKPRRWASSFRE